MDLIDGKGAPICPPVPQDGIQQATARGATLIDWFGQEFLLLDRMFTHAAQTIAGRGGRHTRDQTLPVAAESHRTAAARRVYWAARRLTVSLSAWAEPLTEKICSPA